MRLFIAFPLPETIKTILGRYIETIKYCGLNASFVKPQNLHLTIKFLGEVSPEAIENIKTAMEKIAAGFPAINVHLANFGFFPNEKRPRVFFISTDNENRLETIARALEEDLEKSGFAKENRFKSHITLARFKNADNLEKLTKKTETLKLHDEFTIDRITLFRSTLSPQGPTYEEIYYSSFSD